MKKIIIFNFYVLFFFINITASEIIKQNLSPILLNLPKEILDIIAQYCVEFSDQQNAQITKYLYYHVRRLQLEDKIIKEGNVHYYIGPYEYSFSQDLEICQNFENITLNLITDNQLKTFIKSIENYKLDQKIKLMIHFYNEIKDANLKKENFEFINFDEFVGKNS